MARPLLVGLTIDPVGTEEEVSRLAGLLQRKKIRTTVTAVGRIGDRVLTSVDHLRPFLDGSHEIANHTHSHPNRIGYISEAEQEREILLQHRRLGELSREAGRDFPVKGFRAPYYAYDENLFAVLKRCGYRWDSSSLYSPLLGIPFKPFMRDGVVEIPALFPDDVTLIERMLQTPEQIYEVWLKCYRAAEKYFIWTVHPYGSAKDEKTFAQFARFLAAIEEDGGQFLTLSEIAEEIAK